MSVNLFNTAKSQGTIPSPSHVESQKPNPTDEKIKTTLANIPVKESDHEGEKKVVNDGSKKRKGCSSSKKMDKVRRLALEKSEEKKESEEEPLTFIIANQEIQLPPSYKERLARDSDFFRGLFTHPMQETITGKYKIEDIELEEFKKLITLWSGDSTISAQEAFDLLEAGHRLGLGEPLVEILIPTIKNWSPTDAGDIETACALSHALFLDSLPSLKSGLETFLVKAYLAASNHGVQNLLERIQALDIRDLNLTETHIDDKNIEILVKLILMNCPNLTKLSLQRTRITDQSAMQIAKLSNLTSLDISACLQVTDVGIAVIADKLTKLKELDLRDCTGLTDAAMKDISKLTNLEGLSLNSCNKLTDAGLERIASLAKLTRLDVNYCKNLTSKGMQHIIKLTNLTDLRMDSCSELVTDETMGLILKLCHLRSLSVNNCDKLTDEGLNHINKLFHLTKLSIGSCDSLTDKGYASIAKLLNLTHLDLECSRNLTKKSMLLVAEKCCHLTSLNLRGCGLEEDLVEIARLLPNLTDLNLSILSLTENGIVQTIRHLPKLTRLNIRQCSSVTDSVIKQLAPLLPNLKSLDISQSVHLTDEGMRGLTACRNLRELDISWCQRLTDASIEHMIQLPRLVSIVLDYTTPITEPAIKKMRARAIQVRQNWF